jgi:predicted Zn-dependent peptidase
MMFNAVYGASPISYLFMNVREKLSLCYFCSSSLNAQKGLLLVYAGISKENKQKAYDEIIKQLDRIKNGDISEEDMDGARKMLVNQYLTVTDELFSSDSYYLNSYMGNQEISTEEYIAAINAVTADDIKACARKLSLDTVYFLTSPNESKDGER